MNCADYVGDFCVNGLCPKITHIKMSCDECWYNEGCADCYNYVKNSDYGTCEGDKDGNY